MTVIVVFSLLATVPGPPECEAPPTRDVSPLKAYAQKSGTLSVGLDSVATWCFDSSGSWTGGQRPEGKKPKPIDPNAPPVGDCARALTSCEEAKTALTDELTKALSETLADLERPYRGQKYVPRRSGLNERPSASVNCRERSRPELFAQAQARMDLARLASTAQNEYANYKTWLFARGLECGQQVRAGRVDTTRVSVSVDAPTQGSSGSTATAALPPGGAGGGSAVKAGGPAGGTATASAGGGSATVTSGSGQGVTPSGATGASGAVAGAQPGVPPTSGAPGRTGTIGVIPPVTSGGAAGLGPGVATGSSPPLSAPPPGGSGGGTTGGLGAPTKVAIPAPAATSGASGVPSTGGVAGTGAGANPGAGPSTLPGSPAGPGGSSGSATGPTGLASATTPTTPATGGTGQASIGTPTTGAPGSVATAPGSGAGGSGPSLSSIIMGPSAGPPASTGTEALLETWKGLAAQRGKMELDRDYTLGFLASRELRDCRCQRTSPAGVVARLQNNDGVAQLEADNQRAMSCELCLQNAFAAWKARIGKQCPLLMDLSPYELEVLQRSDDGNGIPPRCWEEVVARRGLDGGTLLTATSVTPKPATPAATLTVALPVDAGVKAAAPVATAPMPTGMPKFEPTSPLADGFFRPNEPAPIPLREDGRLYVRLFMSSTCAADVLPGPLLARTGDLLLIPYGASTLSLRSPCGGLAEVYWGKEPTPRVSEVFGRNQPLHLQFRPQ